MSRQKVRSRKPSSFLLTLGLRWRRFSASWRLRRATRALEKESRRQILLLQMVDSSSLRLKELEASVAGSQHRLQEMAESRTFREQGSPELDRTPLPPELTALPPSSAPARSMPSR